MFIVNKLSGLFIVLGKDLKYVDCFIVCINCVFLMVKIVYCFDMVILGIICLVMYKEVYCNLSI